MRIIILGGGIGGVMSALRLAEKFPDVEIMLVEKQPVLLAGASDKTPGRAGLGFHYVHPKSAIMYLEETIAFYRHFHKGCPDLLLGANLPVDHPIRNGRYFIVKNSEFPVRKILETYEEIALAYAKLVEKDPENKVFGEPENFYRVLKPKEYLNDVVGGLVEVGIETHEHLLNWPRLKAFLLEQIVRHENIKVFTGHAVKDIAYSYKDYRYIIDIDGQLEPADFVINATWEWVDYFNSRIGHYRAPGEVRTNRAKIIIKVELPLALKDKHSMFFCMGPHCMFSNMGDGFGMMTYAPETNAQNSTDLIPSEDYLAYIKGMIPTEKKLAFAHKIIDGVSKYVPAMRQAKIVDIGFGTVQVEGEANIFDHGSKVHERDYSGLRILEDGFIALACMKLLYGLGNANTVTDVFSQFVNKIRPARKGITDEIKTVLDSSDELKADMLTGICFAYMKNSKPCIKQRGETVSPTHFATSFFQKLAVNDEILKHNVAKKQKEERKNTVHCFRLN